MRKGDRINFEIQRKQLSRISQFIIDLRYNPETIEKYPSFKKLFQQILDIEGDEILDGGDAVKLNSVLYAFGDLLSEAVWPK